MARSLGLLAVVIVVLMFIGPARALILPSGKDRMPPVDYAGDVTGFNTVASAPALVPTALPSGWRPNAANVDNIAAAAHLHIGWAVPGSTYAGLDEGTGNSDALLRTVTGTSALTVRATTTIDGVTWTVRRSNRDETVLTRSVDGVFVIVTGNATNAQLRLLAASLH